MPQRNRDIEYNTGGMRLWQFLAVVAIGAGAVFAPVIVTAIWIAICLAVVFGFVKGRMEYTWYAIAASPALEIWSRMSSAPLVPYESGKYFLAICLCLFFIRAAWQVREQAQYHIGRILVLVLSPSLIVGLAYFDFEQWVFNALSIVELGSLLIIAARERWHIERFCRTLQLSLLSIVALMIYISVKSPALSEMQFSLKANAGSSGGFGSNQVSTILGVGIVLTVILMVLKRPLFSFRLFNYVLLAALLFRGLLTFSRGGMVVAAIALFILFIPKIFASVGSFIKYLSFILLFAIAGTAVFYKVNDMTGNMLLLRYQGETAGTLEGSKVKTLNTVLSGRGDVVMSDLEIFKDNWLFGAAPGQSKLLRRSYGYDMDVAAHTEYTRLMSEHGVGGLIAVIAMFIFPIYWLRRQHIATWKGIIAALFTLAILTAFHSATRTNITVVYYVLAAIPVLYGVNNKTYPRTLANDSIHR